MGAGVAAVGAVASLAQAGIGAHQANVARKAQGKAMEALRAMGMPANAYESMRIGNEAYAAEEAKNAQMQSNIVQNLQEMGTTAALGGVPAVQQQAEATSADIAARKAKDLQELELLKRQQSQKISEDYLNFQKELGLMELQGAGAARAQGNQSMWQGLGGLTSVAGSALGNKNLVTGWGLKG